MMMRSLPLERRIAALEKALRGACTCRREQATGYHTLAELDALMSIRCPVHGRRDLGVVVWLPPDSPLFPADRELCLCSPSAAREWREGRRGPLTAEEREQVYARWEEQVSGEAAGKIRQALLLDLDSKASRGFGQSIEWRPTRAGGNKGHESAGQRGHATQCAEHQEIDQTPSQSSRFGRCHAVP